VVLGVLLAAALAFWLVGEHGRLLRPSTWKGMKAQGLRNFINLHALHMYVYGR
jgi:hypothetical protein